MCIRDSFYDVASHAKRPFVASHSDARTICPAVRNLTDDMIRLLAEKGGVTGLNFCPSFLNAQKDYPGTAADVARHAAHIIKVGGEDCLGLGSDFDGIRTHAELPGADAMPVLEDALAKAGDVYKRQILDSIRSSMVRAVMLSTTTTARGTMTGSWRPLICSVRSTWSRPMVCCG